MSETEDAPEGRPKRGPEDRSDETLTAGSRPPAAGSASIPHEVHPGDTVGRYQIRGMLGAGGMGQVFTALDPQLSRIVALKLLSPDGRGSSSRARTRLLREAQALAKLQHRNVVAIHDVGTEEDRVFIAMELVAGPTLAAWLKASERPWRAILETFVAAGRGLVAAHEVGIVHRDFKPQNVIVGSDRVVVVDFGLACARGDEPASAGERGHAAWALDVNVTLTGERVGTPRYMAPEQHAGEPVTALADEFAFATSLWTALYGDPPFGGETAAEVLAQVERHQLLRPTNRRIPDHVRQALERALAYRPSDRWPAMADLLVELGRDPSAGRRRFMAVLAASVAAIAVPVAFIIGRGTPPASCAAEASGLWNDATRTEVRSAFLATGKIFAADSFERVDAALRARVTRWEEAREEACAATEIRHQQSAALMDARMGCLARARDQIATFVDVLRSADALAVERATVAAASVGDLAACADPSLLTTVPPPSDPETAAAVRDVDRDLARVGALVLVGRLQAAQESGPAVIERASALGYAPLLARALYDIGANTCDQGDLRDGTAMLYRSVSAAAAAHDDFLVARVYTKLVFCAGTKDVNIGAGMAFVEAAEAALVRVGTPAELRARLYRQECRLRRTAGDLVNALAFAELGLLTNRRLYGEEHSEVGLSLGDVAVVLDMLGAYRGALAVYARALPMIERARGPNHPALAAYMTNMGNVVLEAGDVEAAAAAFQRGLAIQEQNAGPMSIGNYLRHLSSVRERQGQFDAAWDMVQRARAIDEKTRRPDHPDLALDDLLLSEIALGRGDLHTAQTYADRAATVFGAKYGADRERVADMSSLEGQIARKRHDLERARVLTQTALDVRRKALGPRHPYVANDESALAAILLESGQPRAALPLLEEALAIQEGARNDDADEVVVARTLLARALLATGDRARALALAERAVAVTNARPVRADIDGNARFVLAQALGPADRARAVDLAQKARTSLEGSPANEEVARVDEWLKHPARGPSVRF